MRLAEASRLRSPGPAGSVPRPRLSETGGAGAGGRAWPSGSPPADEDSRAPPSAPGRPGHDRPPPSPDEIDGVQNHAMTHCPGWQSRLRASDEARSASGCNVVVELLAQQLLDLGSLSLGENGSEVHRRVGTHFLSRVHRLRRAG